MGTLPTTYTVDELASIWKCSSRFVYDLLRQGRLAGFRIGSTWRISDEARIAYEQGKQTQTRRETIQYIH